MECDSVQIEHTRSDVLSILDMYINSVWALIQFKISSYRYMNSHYENKTVFVFYVLDFRIMTRQCINTKQHSLGLLRVRVSKRLWPLLLTWINFSPSMDN